MEAHETAAGQSLVPRPLVEAYWLGYAASHSASPPGEGLDLDEIPAKTPVNVVKIAFYNLFPNNGVSTCFGMSGNGISWKYTAQGIATLQAAGIKVMASLIGTPDPEVGWGDQPDPKAFAANVKGLLVDSLGCDGIDLDMDGGAPGASFPEVVSALRAELGPKGSPKSLLTAVVYQPGQDLVWLDSVGQAFDWVSTMAYWGGLEDQQQLAGQYAPAVGGMQNVLVGVACDGGLTSVETVQGVAQWEETLGAGGGGMMLWDLSNGDYGTYYATIAKNMPSWHPPAPPSGG
jgi:hypothetical protein